MQHKGVENLGLDGMHERGVMSSPSSVVQGDLVRANVASLLNNPNSVLANKLFPETTETMADLEMRYPSRSGKLVSRFAPSPTGFMHIGGIYNALVAEKFIHKNNGVFILRIEDTDKEREVIGAADGIMRSMRDFGIDMDEGPLFDGSGKSSGEYGPYTQSERAKIYHVFAKELFQNGRAYPCFLTSSEIEAIKQKQQELGATPGIYGEYSPWKNASPEEISAKLSEGKPYVIRFHATGTPGGRRIINDEVHGEMNLNDNILDIVLLKTDGIPTYHFAHIVDDYLMRTTHVIRGDEWIPSLPLHIQLFEAFGITPPKYVHMAPLMKVEDGNKRKLSKRKDPEANVEYFFEQGFPQAAVIEYLCNVMDSRFESWRLENPNTPLGEFPFDLGNLSKSGALYDEKKLLSVSNSYLSRLSNEDLFELYLEWVKKYEPQLYAAIIKNKDLLLEAISLERHKEKDPKRYSTLQGISEFIRYFMDDFFERDEEILPQNIPSNIRAAFLRDFLEYLAGGDEFPSKEEWLDEIKKISGKHGFASDNAQYAKGGYIGKMADAAMILRWAIVGKKKSQDLHGVMRVLGKEICISRMQAGLLHIQGEK